ncbi:hypothetical protein A3A67_02445 [Candidatus Peribacteria bacterium RIFCSPLOWO2_01_FULL_51_18]|nr:MAG: hypothetical protein A3C52_04845 [Candidatus Peribacteria bacterium RIFCSPHIGHO2_02_FULL_51_15]OGJ66873.1 MAG: hypothetical protein A3A67_02445 [Candidatus Peribacteria bacterium RIFCSPLOWO2_01_FULL_51_18]
MRRRPSSLIPLLALIPALAFALDFSPAKNFSDVRSSSPEAAGIAMLTREGIVQGYSGGYFGTARLINRAEFLKIAMKSKNGIGGDARSCFGDVLAGDWFSPFVCAAKDLGIVRGRTSELFFPADPVSYGEALAIVTRLYGYEVTEVPNRDWAEKYYRAAAGRRVDLPVTIRLDQPLKRAHAARLVAAFLAESRGELDNLRLAESGNYSVPSSPGHDPSSQGSAEASVPAAGTGTSSGSSDSSDSSVSSASAKSADEAGFTLPPVSHFLIVGKASDAIAQATIPKDIRIRKISSAQVTLFSEARSVERLELTTITGTVVATLRQRATDNTANYKQIYETEIPIELQPSVSADDDLKLILRAVIRTTQNNGFSDDLLDIRTFAIYLHPENSAETQSVIVPAPFPKNQTAFGHITKVSRVTPLTQKLESSTGGLISTFSFSGTAIPGKAVSLEQLIFTPEKIGDFTVKNWSINKQGSNVSVTCTLGQDGNITCPGLQNSIGQIDALSQLILELRADITLPAGFKNGSLKADLLDSGTPGSLGSVQWTDDSGHFRWIESVKPVAEGTFLN